MNKLKDILLKSKYELSLFAALCMNFLLFFTKNDIMSDAIYPIHLVDLKIGFISRTLVGTINGLLFQNPTKAEVAFIQTIVCIITFFLTSVFLGKCIRKADENSGRILFVISLIIAVFPYGFMTFINLFELLDIYWLLSAVLCLISAENKATALLIPVFIIVGLWSHYAFLLAFMPVIYILCFSFCLKHKSKYAYILTAFMIAVSVPATLYFFATNRTFNVISFSEFEDYIMNKAGDKIILFEPYCGEIFRPMEEFPFEHYEEVYSLPGWVKDASPSVQTLYCSFFFAFADSSVPGVITDIILVIPVVLFFEAIWKKAMSTTEDKTEKFIYFLCLISPIIQLIACLTSSDTSRWLSIMVISSLFLLALFIKEKTAPVSEALCSITEKLEKHKAPLLFVLLFYLTIVFVW